jgi:hypothetical protein
MLMVGFKFELVCMTYWGVSLNKRMCKEVELRFKIHTTIRMV